MEDKCYENFRKMRRLPSVETQLIFWFQLVDKGLIYPNLWLKRAGFEVYIRKSKYTINKLDYNLLDIGYVTIHERHRGRGWFKNFRFIAEDMQPWDGVIHQGITNKKLLQYFKKQGLHQYNEAAFIKFKC